MIATLTFDLEEPSEKKTYQRYALLTEMSLALWDMEQEFSRTLKYDEGLSSEAYDEVQRLSMFLQDTLEEYQLLNIHN